MTIDALENKRRKRLSTTEARNLCAPSTLDDHTPPIPGTKAYWGGGALYRYDRLTGERLETAGGSFDSVGEIHRLQNSGSSVHKRKSIRDVWKRYMESAEFRELVPETQKHFKKAMRWISPRARMPLSQMDSAQIRRFESMAVQDGKRLGKAVAAVMLAALGWHGRRVS